METQNIWHWLWEFDDGFCGLMMPIVDGETDAQSGKEHAKTEVNYKTAPVPP